MTSGRRSADEALVAFAKREGAGTPLVAMELACASLLSRSGYAGGRPSLGHLVKAARAVVRDSSRAPTLGRLTVDSAAYVITVQSSAPHLRRAFTVAHEIGHILLYEGVVVRDPSLVTALVLDHADETVEMLCNRGAGAMLMPTDDFRVRLLAEPVSPSSLVNLARFYGVSMEAALTRVSEVLTDTDVFLLARDENSHGQSQVYHVLRQLPSRSGEARRLQQEGGGPYSPQGSGAARRLLARHLRPNLLASCAEREEPVSSADFIASWSGLDPVRGRAIAFRADPLGVASQVNGTLANRREWQSVDYVLILQRKSAPISEWRALRGTTTRTRAQQRLWDQ